MTVGLLARLVGAPVKWVQNTLMLLGLPRQYSTGQAQALSLTHELVEAGLPLGVAHPLATRALASWPARRVYRELSGAVAFEIDLERALSAFAIRLAAAAGTPGPARGRPPRPRRGSALRRARRHGVDIGLLRANLARTPAERLVALEQAAQFLGKVHRR